MKRLPVILATVVLLAACGDKSPPATSPGGTAPASSGNSSTSAVVSPTASSSGATAGSTTTAPPTTAKGAPAASGNASGKLPVACTFVAKGDIAGAYGAASSDGVKSEDSDNQCDFTISGTTKAGPVGLFDQVSVSIDTRDADSSYDRVKVVFPNAVKVDIGDEAYSLDTVVYQLHILKGRYELVIAGPLLADKAASKQVVDGLGRTLVTRL